MKNNPLLATPRESRRAATKTQHSQQYVNKHFKKKKLVRITLEKSHEELYQIQKFKKLTHNADANFIFNYGYIVSQRLGYKQNHLRP